MLKKFEDSKTLTKEAQVIQDNLFTLLKYTERMILYYSEINANTNIGKVNFLFNLKSTKIITPFIPQHGIFFPHTLNEGSINELALLILEFDQDSQAIKNKFILVPFNDENNINEQKIIIEKIINTYNDVLSFQFEQ